MELISPKIEDRNFLVQFEDIHQEFGKKIPWMKGVNKLKYFLDEQIFKENLLKILGLSNQEEFDSYVLTTGGRNNEYIGGIWSFSHSPEKFSDDSNELVRKDLEGSDYGYITCLQIRDVMRGSSKGKELFGKSLEKILGRLEKVRGVVSDLELIPYYQAFGATIENNVSNKDGLVMITFKGTNLR